MPENNATSEREGLFLAEFQSTLLNCIVPNQGPSTQRPLWQPRMVVVRRLLTSALPRLLHLHDLRYCGTVFPRVGGAVVDAGREIAQDGLASGLALRLSQAAPRVIRQNLVVSLGTVVVLVAFATLGKIPLTAGVLGHEGSTVIVVLNSLRLLFTRLKGGRGVKTGEAS
jgi:hypothetical protein